MRSLWSRSSPGLGHILLNILTKERFDRRIIECLMENSKQIINNEAKKLSSPVSAKLKREGRSSER